MQGTDEAGAAEADAATAEAEQTSETASDEAQVPQTQADESTAQTDAADTADTTAPIAPVEVANGDDAAQASLRTDDVTDAPPADETAAGEPEAESEMPEVAVDSTEEADGRPLGAADEGAALATPISGYFLGLSKRSIQVA